MILVDTRLHESDGPKDANDALRMGWNFKDIIKNCTYTLGEKNVLSFSDIKDKVMNRILNYQELSGV